MKYSIFTIVWLCCSLVYASQVRSSVGARLQGMLASENQQYTPADYVQDGLMAMWDGEWNAGIELHEDSPSRWIDLIGGNDLTLLQGVVFGSNFVTTDNSFGSSYYGAVNQRIEFLTIEFVFETESPAQQYIQMDLYRRSSVGVWDTYIGVGLWKAVSYGRSTVGERISASVFYPTFSDNVPIHAYVNGEALPFVNVNFSKPYSVAWTIGGTAYGNPFIGKIFCVRLYDRELSDSERIHNLKVDEGRFGL